MANTSQAPAGSREVQTSLTDRERAQVQRLFSDPTELPPIFKNWITSWTEQDVALALTQIQGWSDFLNSQTATDASQASGIASNASGISSLNSTTASQASQIAALQSVDTTQNGTLATHTTQIAAGATLDTTQNGRLTALEAHPFPRILASTFTEVNTNFASEQNLCSLTLPSGVLTAPGILEFWAAGTWNSVSAQNNPRYRVYLATTLVGDMGTALGSTDSGGAEIPWEVRTRIVNTIGTGTQEIFTTFSMPTGIGTAKAQLWVDRRTAAVATGSGSKSVILTSQHAVQEAKPAGTHLTAATLTLLAGS